MTSLGEPQSDNRLLRGQQTRRLPMHAAEKLIAEKGLEADFRRYVKAFGHQLTLLEDSAAAKAASRGGGVDSGIELGKLLRRAVPQLSKVVFRQRMDFAIRLCSSAMYAQAGTVNAFRGQQSEFFIEVLIDALVGLLSAPERVGAQVNTKASS